MNKAFHNTSNIYTELWRDTVPFDRKCSILQLAVAYTVGKLTSYHVNTNISNQAPCGLSYEKEEITTQSPPAPFPATPLSMRFCHRNTPELSAFGFYLKSARNLNCFVAWYNTNKATDIVLERCNLRIGKRFEDCIS